jgi:thiamine biosynthesis protein ThiI
MREIGRAEDPGQTPERPLVLVRFYHEIALKGDNRAQFFQALRRNLKAALAGTGAGPLLSRSMMALVPLRPEASWPLVKERLEHVIGVERFGLGWRVAPSLEAIKGLLARHLNGVTAASFRITAHRADKRFPLASPQINQELGAFVKELTGLPVDLEHPALNVRVSILPQEALVSLEELPGPGGLPVGISGQVAVMLSGGIDSPVAAYMMMQRGCRVLFIHFHSFPLVEGTSREKAQDLVRLLTRYQLDSRLLLVPFAEVQKRILLTSPPAYRVVLYRRFMLRIAEALATRAGAGALVTGESLGQVSSQTLENLSTIEAVRERLPIFRPLIAMDKEEVVHRAQALGTYPISILPDQDCCSLFVPKHPVIRSRRAEVDEMESGLDAAAMVEEALAGVQELRFHWPEREGGRTPSEAGVPAGEKGSEKAARGS